jgi:hypothetical protein
LPPYPPPTLLQHLGELFQAADGDGRGQLPAADFARTLAGLGLGLAQPDVVAWLRAADHPGGFASGGEVAWEAFEPQGDQRLRELLLRTDRDPAGSPAGSPAAWALQADAHGRKYERNWATGDARWDPKTYGENDDDGGGGGDGWGEEGVLSDWEALVDENGYPCWYSHVSGETTYENPTDEEDWVQGMGEHGHIDEVVAQVFTNVRGNRVFVVHKQPRQSAAAEQLDPPPMLSDSRALTPHAGSAMAGLASPDVSFYESWAGDGQPPLEWPRPEDDYEEAVHAWDEEQSEAVEPEALGESTWAESSEVADDAYQGAPREADQETYQETHQDTAPGEGSWGDGQTYLEVDGE